MKSEKIAAVAVMALSTAFVSIIDGARADELSADIYSRANAIFTIDGAFQEQLFASTRAGGLSKS